MTLWDWNKERPDRTFFNFKSIKIFRSAILNYIKSIVIRLFNCEFFSRGGRKSCPWSWDEINGIPKKTSSKQKQTNQLTLERKTIEFIPASVPQCRAEKRFSAAESSANANNGHDEKIFNIKISTKDNRISSEFKPANKQTRYRNYFRKAEIIALTIDNIYWSIHFVNWGFLHCGNENANKSYTPFDILLPCVCKYLLLKGSS